MPTLLAFSISIHAGDQFFLAVLSGAHHDEHTLLLISLIFQANLDMNAIHPNVGISLVAQVSAAPRLVLLGPLFFQSNHDIGA